MKTTQLRAWTVEEYHRMIEAGILTTEDQVELLEGQIVQMSPQKSPHAATTHKASDVLQKILAETALIRTQFPITLLPDSEPEPDIVVVRPDPRYYLERHPDAGDILLLIEVSDSTLDYDRRCKAGVYARVGIADYWILVQGVTDKAT
ncbi:Uma2 family endonuclease [Gloeobacter morelensis]|uniref:Uma2 family endonuclease n=1 Tax=Gloeobacter morelensis MG652769 TaxID=2781736 RepID=A0ABY3PSJ8_9CYAN|nr:Uma2 family endonuclease [Gloeobacter morelensis]UFP96710.1 Uma2 family endonuclease [Gloeobacter morelensis MG652769]